MLSRSPQTSAKTLTVCYDSSNPEDRVSTLTKTVTESPSRSLIFSTLMAISGALLGPFLDSYHSAFGVLQYDRPITAVLWGNSEHPALILITTWWVPPLFGLAGFIIGWLYILLDSLVLNSTGRTGDPPEARTSLPPPSPSPPQILIGISLFTFQYWLSGVLFQSGIDRIVILNVMSIIAACGFLLLDGSLAGLVTSTATALGGPLIEIGLLNLSRLGLMLGESGYHYTDTGETGYFPLWIAPVYFLGGPAVGNLARGFWDLLLVSSADPSPKLTFAQRQQETRPLPGCKVCNDSRQVPCPNCDGVGTYVAMGGRSVVCKCCKGRGLVICRSCFSNYGEDPEDIEAIRQLLSRMPD